MVQQSATIPYFSVISKELSIHVVPDVASISRVNNNNNRTHWRYKRIEWPLAKVNVEPCAFVVEQAEVRIILRSVHRCPLALTQSFHDNTIQSHT